MTTNTSHFLTDCPVPFIIGIYQYTIQEIEHADTHACGNPITEKLKRGLSFPQKLFILHLLSRSISKLQSI